MIQTLQSGLIVKRVLLGCMMILLGLNLSGQSQAHFTDFRMAPSALNPALTGAFKGTYRINGIYRSQWFNVSTTQGAQTLVGSADFNIKAGLLLENDWISGGLSIYSDKAGSANKKFNLTGLNIGYHIGLDKSYTTVISAGISYGSLGSTVSNNAQLSDLVDNPTQEAIDNGQIGGCQLPGCDNRDEGPPKATDLSLGFSFKTELESGTLIRLGVSVLHLNEPESSVSTGRGGVMPPDPNDPNPPMPPINPDPDRNVDAFQRVFVLHGESSTLLSPKVRLNPAFFFGRSGITTEIQLQSTLDYLVNVKENFSITGGVGMRPLPSFDAIYFIAGVKIKDLSVRLSYDINTSSFSTLGGNSSFELSVGYIGRIYRDAKSDKVIFCPRL